MRFEFCVPECQKIFFLLFGVEQKFFLFLGDSCVTNFKINEAFHDFVAIAYYLLYRHFNFPIYNTLAQRKQGRFI